MFLRTTREIEAVGRGEDKSQRTIRSGDCSELMLEEEEDGVMRDIEPGLFTANPDSASGALGQGTSSLRRIGLTLWTGEVTRGSAG